MDVRILEVTENTRRGIQEIFGLAGEVNTLESKTAFWSLYQITSQAVGLLNQLAEMHPECLRPMASTAVEWPAFISTFGDYHKKNVNLLKTLQLGTKASIKTTGKRISLKIPINTLTRDLVHALEIRIPLVRNVSEEFASSLFPQAGREIRLLRTYNTKTWKMWFEAGWLLLLERTDGHPESDPTLRQIGKYREKHSKQTGAQKEVTKATGESNIRQGIRDRLKLAFKAFAPLA